MVGLRRVQSDPALAGEVVDVVMPDSEGTVAQEETAPGSTKSTVVPPHSSNKRSAAWGRGILDDAKGTVGIWWCKEMSNLNGKTIAVSFFLFFACISPAITFGAIYAKKTNNYIGAVEMILATAWVGIFYALLGGQPIMINGGTGPVLAFTEILYKMSVNADVPFLTFNAWIGVWVCIYMLLAAFFDWNRIIQHATRFTDEIFALLISAIFIMNALGSPFVPVGIYYYFESDHASHEEELERDPDYSVSATALLSLVICLGTVQVALALRKVKFSPFFVNQTMRNVLTDFSVVLSIAVWTIFPIVLFPNVPTERLNVPDSFAPTFACCTDECTTYFPDDCPDLEAAARRRPWLVSLSNLNGKTWVPFVAAGPALLAFILVFLDNGITWHLINHPTHKITHGAAYNYDTLIIGTTILVNSLLGLPWLVAATVRSLNHVHALAEKSPDGKILSVQETRLTHLGIHILCTVSIFALNVLQLIPMPVLYGVFLFMGLVSLGTNQLWGRFLMFFMQPSQYPIEPYTTHVRPGRMHLFTVIQMSMFVVLYAVKAIKPIAIAFPLIIALCIPVRMYVLPKIFTEKELIMIDSDDDVINNWLSNNKLDGDDDDDDDENDQSFTSLESSPTSSTLRRRPRRTKSRSCPPDMLFAELPVEVTTTTSTLLEQVPENEPVEDCNVPARQRRPRRTKTLSCPAHMLFAEADRHVQANYFFG